MQTTIDQNADLRGLSRALVAQAVRDLTGRDPIKALDALAWLVGPDFPWWAEGMGASFLNVYYLLPRIREARKILSTRRIPK